MQFCLEFLDAFPLLLSKTIHLSMGELDVLLDRVRDLGAEPLHLFGLEHETALPSVMPDRQFPNRLFTAAPDVFQHPLDIDPGFGIVPWRIVHSLFQIGSHFHSPILEIVVAGNQQSSRLRPTYSNACRREWYWLSAGITVIDTTLLPE
jgi:hypothetical protein